MKVYHSIDLDKLQEADIRQMTIDYYNNKFTKVCIVDDRCYSRIEIIEKIDPDVFEEFKNDYIEKLLDENTIVMINNIYYKTKDIIGILIKTGVTK